MATTASCLAQGLSLVDRNHFGRAVRRHDAERGSKGFTCWEQFVSMLFCQLGAAHSLREIHGGLATAMGKLVHLGMRKAPPRSTLSYANEHRPWEVALAALVVVGDRQYVRQLIAPRFPMGTFVTTFARSGLEHNVAARAESACFFIVVLLPA